MFQELFAEMDAEEDGAVYLSVVVMTLKALNKDIEANLQVKSFLLRFGLIQSSRV